MPSIIDQLKAAGITIPDGLTNEVLFTSLQGATEFEGLANKNKELLSWKAENKPLLDSLLTEKEQLIQKAKEEEEKSLQLARENGDFKKEAEITAKQLKEFQDNLKASQERARKSAHESAQSAISSKFMDDVYGAFYADKSVVTELNEAGEPVTKFKFGEQLLDSADEWLKVAIKDEKVASQISIGGEHKGPAMGGNGQGGGQPEAKANKAADEAAAKGDLNGYLSAALNLNQ